MNVNNNVFTDKVVVVCPTYNRRKFLPSIIYQFSYQTYPESLLHMIILDDSDNSNEDIYNMINNDLKLRITYVYNNERKLLGAKRNILNNMALTHNPKYIACFDDDDYYPPDRISYGVQMLTKNGYLIGGSSTLPVYYTNNKDIYILGPYLNKIHPGHASNGTLIYDVRYLNDNKYDDNAAKSVEIKFLNNFKSRLLQIPYEHVILCISHNTNMVDKNSLSKTGKKVNISISEVIKDKYLLDFFMKL